MKHGPRQPATIYGFFVALVSLTQTIAAEPEIHILAPDFVAKRLPLELTNVNALAFAPDGKLFAAGYDGKIRRLIDTNADGLEDKAEVIWDKTPLISPIQLLWSPEGFYVSHHQKVSLLIDDDKDGKLDREVVVATGWPKVPTGSNLIDAMGIALGKDNSLYIGIGCADYANPYLIKDGKAHYSRKDETGTILKVAPDRKSREIFASGLRFTYALHFNQAGDLFATDQEGETWMKGANPLDEFNHISQGRHYGWPPKHEQHLPNVNDEPPVVTFSPQHQSSCGFVFNEEKPGWKLLGPSSWDGNAFVAGFSRGKIWRVVLVKTPAGYVGKPLVFAVANRMISDIAISPSGSLYFSAHSGQPDWGTGPNGSGDLFKISYVDSNAPQPVIAWPAGPLEVRIAFDKPVSEQYLAGLTGSTIAYGDYVRAGDRFGTLLPPYKAVEEQQAAARGSLKIAGARLIDGGRTIVLVTDPHSRRATCATTIAKSIDLSYDLSGVEVSWDNGSKDAKPEWSGWWPHLDPGVVRSLTKGSAEHEQSLALLSKPGKLTLRTLISLPRGKGTVRLFSEDSLAEVSLGGEASEIHRVGRHSGTSAEASIESTGEPIELAVTRATGTTGFGNGPRMTISYSTAADPASRIFPLDRFAAPWAPAAPPSSTAPVTLPSELANGDAKRGEAVFFSDTAKCATCHTMRGKGGNVGPDLSNSPQKSAASIYRDINEPSVTINPDYVPYIVQLKDGRVLSGVVRAEGIDAIRVTDTEAKFTVVPRGDIEELRPSATSIMPVGLVVAIGEAKMRDLLAYLLAKDEQPKK